VSNETPAPLTLQRYQELAVSTDQMRDSSTALAFPLLGLFGETGSLLSEVKKKRRDAASYVRYARSVIEELGDVLWYMTSLAARADLSIADIAYSVNRGLETWDRARAPDLAFALSRTSRRHNWTGPALPLRRPC
jgi:NTP pyrophosphatase (non-canonical NTP hydrolase)